MEDAQLWYYHQGGWGWGEGGVLTFLTSTSLTLRKMHTLHMLSSDHQGGMGVGRWGGWGSGFELESRRRRTKGSVVGEEWCQNAAPLR